MNEKEYYRLMANMCNLKSFKEIHDAWLGCFTYILQHMRIGYTKKVILHLFYAFEMANWNAMHRENTEYADKDKDELLKDFAGECGYISDRVSYDRLFRTHWLFLQAFSEEMDKERSDALHKLFPEPEQKKHPLSLYQLGEDVVVVARSAEEARLVWTDIYHKPYAKKKNGRRVRRLKGTSPLEIGSKTKTCDEWAASVGYPEILAATEDAEPAPEPKAK